MIDNKKFRLWVMLLGVLCFLIPNNIFAEGETVKLTGPTNIAPGGTVVYSIAVGGGAGVVSGGTFDAEITFDQNVLTTKNTAGNGNWIVTTKLSSSGKKVEFKCASSCPQTIGTITFSVASKPSANSANLMIKNSNYTNGEETTPYGQNSLTLKVQSTDATLKSLSVNGTPVDKFSSNNYNYDVAVAGNISSAIIEAKTNNDKASLKTGYGNRTVALEYGNNTVKVIAVAESGKEQVYTLNISREDIRSTDTTLSGITIDGTAIDDFSPTKYNYTIKKFKATSVKIEAIPTDSNAKAEVAGPQVLAIGENEFVITVTSEKGDKATYSVIINNVDSNISKMLKSLNIRGYNINFDKNNYVYEIRYSKNLIKNLHIYCQPVAKDDEVTVTIEPDINKDPSLAKDLKIGDEINITITGIDGESSKYTIKIVKDNRINFFMLLEIFILIVLIIIIIILYTKKKDSKPSKKTSTKKKEIEDNQEDSNEEIDDSTDEEEAPKKEVIPRRERRRRGEKVELEQEVEATKELSTEELNLK